MGLRTQLETHDSALVFGGQVKHTLVGKLHMPEDCIAYIVLHPPMKMFYPFIIMNTLGFSVLSDAIRYTLWDCIL